MSSIAILGLGNFGTALARVLLLDGHSIVGWTVEEDVFESIDKTGINEKYLAGIKLDGLRASMSLGDVIPGADIVVLALPSGVVLKVLDDVIPLLAENQILIDLAKGLAPGDRLVSEAIEDQLEQAGKHNSVVVMMGPTIAPEMARGVLTVALVASNDPAAAAQVAKELTTSTLKLQPAPDPVGAEYWGAFKNVIALACGVADGLPTGGGDNLKAAIFTAGYRAGCQFLPTLGAQPETALGPAGIGDLYVTATSPHGRNRQMGEKLGSGLSLEQALGEMVMVSEGVRATRMFAQRMQTDGVEVPFVTAVLSLIEGIATAQEAVAALLEA
ncbi:MAG: NAD(P)H-dependent glycerol-3-phosphate dehydrogenase [Proteobacteria bacterium]|nr:NAD(P)H-dependent glycerol-3-phosphate dehydrogenase [Pseudomonadota bacterium]